MEPKIVTALLGYVPAPVPEKAEDIPTFLAEELQRIAFPLQVMANSWEPSVSAGLFNPNQPVTVNITPTRLQDYQGERFSRYAPYLNIQLDKALGEINLGGEATSRYTIQVVAFFSMNIQSLPINQEVLLYITDGTTVWSMGSAYIAEPQQKQVSMGSVRLIDTTADSVLYCYLVADSAAGDIALTGGEFDVSVLDSYEPVQVA